ncbi:MAG: hypothetical protein JWM82_2551 [Myxococcales bacterium]|nr:hypothetical protein [Myxococcales bacterium]
MRLPPPRVAGLIIIVGLALAATARGETIDTAIGPAVDVALLAPAHDDRVLVEAAARVRLELGASGFTSAPVETAGDAYKARLAFVREDGVATIDLLGTLADGSALDRRVRVPREEGGDDPAVLAMRAAELLRGMRLARRRVRAAPVAAPEVVTDGEPLHELAPTMGPVRLFAGAAAIEGRLTGAGAGVGPGVILGLLANVTPHVAVLVSVAGPFLRNLEPTPSGSAHTHEELGLFGLRLETRHPLTNASLLLATGAHHIGATPDMRGLVVMPPPAALRLRSTQSLWSPCIAVGVGVSHRLWRHAGISAAVVAVVLQPTIDITFDGRSVGTAGAPSLLETFDLWAAFP